MTSLFSTDRLSPTSTTGATEDRRTPFEQDFDRILFSAPIRRLADKTQVFPLEKNDSVRRRLTHSHEVSNLCRSLATQIARAQPGIFGDAQADQHAPVIAAAVGLAHDLGNPPFGHQGETAIHRWFQKHQQTLWDGETGLAFTDTQRDDFLKWEANAQTFRLVARLQLTNGTNGLNLTAGTLSALMKYSVPSSTAHKKHSHPAHRKFGYFAADSQRASDVFKRVGLGEGLRHPIAYVMEACDDIAYSVIDIEDAIKKRLVSIHDVIAVLETVDPMLHKHLIERVKELREKNKSPHDLNDIAAQYYRTSAIGTMVIAARNAFIVNAAEIKAGMFKAPLIEASAAAKLCKALKDFARDNAYRSSAVKEAELIGSGHIQRLLTYFWRAIDECSLKGDSFGDLRKTLKCAPPSGFGELVYDRISSNYRECFQTSIDPSDPACVRYHQLLLLTDMVSGMTDQYATNTSEFLRGLDDELGPTHA